MEPIYLLSNHSNPENTDPSNTYSLTLSQAVMPERAGEIASVVSRSPIDRCEHSFQFENSNDYLAWCVATDAQRKAAHLGYDPTRAGIEAYVIGPTSGGKGYGRLDDFFTNQPPTSTTRLVVYKQNVMAGKTPIHDYLGPEHVDRFVGGSSRETSATSAGRALLTDLMKGYTNNAAASVLEETQHPFGYSAGFGQRGEPAGAASETESTAASDELEPSTSHSSHPGLRYTRVDLEGRTQHYAQMIRREHDEHIQIEVLTPDYKTTYLVHGGAESRGDQYEAACWLFDQIAPRDAGHQLINAYCDAVMRLVE